MANEEYAVGVVPNQARGRGLEDQIVAKLLAQSTDVVGHPHGLDPTTKRPTREGEVSRLGQCSGMTAEEGRLGGLLLGGWAA